MSSNISKDPGFTELSNLSSEKLQLLDTVLASILALPIAQDTFAQIIHGKAAWQSSPSQRAREQYKIFRKSFSAQVLKLDTQFRRHDINSVYISSADIDIADSKVSKCAARLP